MKMENKEGYLEFLSLENYKHQLDIWYRAYNISREKIQLFHDFLLSLNSIIDDTYLGSDVLESDLDQNGHFNWCWNKTIENFNKEKIFFKDRGNHYDYFWTFFYEAFYLVHLTHGVIRISDYFNKLFDFEHRKSRSELDMLTEIYKMLDQNLKK